MRRSAVCDAGGMLVASGALAGDVPSDIEWLALDWATVSAGRFLAVHHEGNVTRIEMALGLAASVVAEWFPVRPIVADTLRRAGQNEVDLLDSWSALILAERLSVPFFTASDEVTSGRVEVLRPW
jgi:hypothetical protein